MLEAAAKQHTFHHLTAVKAKAIAPAFCKPCRVKTTKSWGQKTSNTNDMQLHTCVTSVNSSWETQSWVHQPKELPPHVVIGFLTCHFCSMRKMQCKKRHGIWILPFQSSNIKHISLLSQGYLNAMWSSQLKLGIVSAFCIAKARTFESTPTATKCDA